MFEKSRRKDRHCQHLFQTVKGLHDSIMDDIITATRKGEDFNVESIKRRARLMVKYSRRLKLLKY